MQVDRENGAVRFPNGLEISPALTQEAFRALSSSQDVQSQNRGTLPWVHYHISGGKIDGKELLVNVCFYDQMLVDVSITAELYAPGPKDWSSYSVEVEAATKQFHDRLLAQMFGKPSKGGRFPFRRLPEAQETLERPLQWDFPWGRVCSYHDSKGGGTYITITYGNRNEEANRAYGRRSVPR